MDNKIIRLTKEHKKTSTIIINDIEINLPTYVLNSISKHQFLIDGDLIYLQRKCNICKKAITIQQLIDNKLVNIENLKIRFIGQKSGFHNTCYNCESIISSKVSSTIDNLKEINQAPTATITTQLNIKIDKDLKKYYQLLALTNESNLAKEIKNALIFYKSYIESPA